MTGKNWLDFGGIRITFIRYVRVRVAAALNGGLRSLSALVSLILTRRKITSTTTTEILSANLASEHASL